MAIVFVIPAPLRALAGNREQVEVRGSAGSLSHALSLLWAECPALRDRVLTELGDVRQHVNIFVDGENIRRSGGLDTRVRDGAEIMLLPAISGGSRSSLTVTSTSARRSALTSRRRTVASSTPTRTGAASTPWSWHTAAGARRRQPS